MNPPVANALVKKTTCHGAFVVDARLCLHHKRTSAAGCVTTTDMFETIVLNRDVLSFVIVHRSDVYNDDYRYV